MNRLEGSAVVLRTMPAEPAVAAVLPTPEFPPLPADPPPPAPKPELVFNPVPAAPPVALAVPDCVTLGAIRWMSPPPPPPQALNSMNRGASKNKRTSQQA